MKRFLIRILSCVLLLMVSCYENPIMDYSITITDNGQYAEDLTYHIVSVATPEGFEDIYYSIDKSSPTSNSCKYSPSSYQGTDSNLHEGILLKEGTTIKAVAYKSKNGTAYSTFVSDLTIGVSKWDITIVDNGPYSEDETKHIITIADTLWNGNIFYYNFSKYEEPSSNYSQYKATEYLGRDSKKYIGVLIPAGDTIKAYSQKNIQESYYTSNVAERLLNQWAISIVDNGPIYEDNTKHIITITDLEKHGDIFYTVDCSEPSLLAIEYLPADILGVDGKTYNGITVSEATTVKAISCRTINDEVQFSLISSLTTSIYPWDISIIDHGQLSDDGSKHIVEIVDSSKKGLITYVLTDRSPTIHSIKYEPSEFKGVDSKTQYGILLDEGKAITACSFININGVEGVSEESKLTVQTVTWQISIEDCGQYIDDKTKKIVRITDSEKNGDIFYTTDESNPNFEGIKYEPKEYKDLDSNTYLGVVVPEDVTVKAISYKDEEDKLISSFISSLYIYKTYQIGEIGPAGGYIFYDADANYKTEKPSLTNGWRYLEAAPNDLDDTYYWGDEVIVKSGYYAERKIVYTAMNACSSYSVNGYEDWFLPNKTYLNKMYEELKMNGYGDFKDETYWSCSTSGTYSAYCQNFANGKQVCSGIKSAKRYIRPIRQF